MSITRASSKAKGRRLVYEVKALLLQQFPELQDEDILVPSGSQHGEDLQLSPKARALFGYSTEMKYQESLSIWAALKQCTKNSKGNTPLLIFKRNHTDIYCCLKLDDLFKLLKK